MPVSAKSENVWLPASCVPIWAQCGPGAGGRAGYKSNFYSNRNIMNISCWDAVEAGPDRHLHPWCASAILVIYSNCHRSWQTSDEPPFGHFVLDLGWIWLINMHVIRDKEVCFTPNFITHLWEDLVCRIAIDRVGRNSLQIWIGRRRISWYISAHRTDWPINQSRKLAVSNSQVQNNWGQVFASCNEFLKHTYWMLKI